MRNLLTFQRLRNEHSDVRGVARKRKLNIMLLMKIFIRDSLLIGQGIRNAWNVLTVAHNKCGVRSTERVTFDHNTHAQSIKTSS